MEPPVANTILNEIRQEIEFKCKNDKKEIKITISTTKSEIFFSSEITKDVLNKINYKSSYSLEKIKEINPYLFLCKSIKDVIEEIKTLVEENKSSFIEETNKITLIIPTHMNKAPQILISINETEKDINLKVQEIYDFISKFYDENKKNNNLLQQILNENENNKNIIKKLEEKVNLLSNENDLLKLHLGIISSDNLDKIKKWIDPQNYQNIKLECIYQFLDCETNRDIFNKKCNVNGPVVILIISKKQSIFGAYASNYATTSGGEKWVGDKNSFIFSLNLNKKYPPININATEHYYKGTCGIHFYDLTICKIYDRKGQFSTGRYLNQYELEGNASNFEVEHIFVYKVIK